MRARRPLARALRHALAVGRRDLALQRSYGLAAALGVASSSLALFSHHFVSRWVGAAPTPGLGAVGYFAFVCSGLVVQLVVTAALAGLGGALARDAHEGTLETSLSAGATPVALVAGSALVPCALAAAQALLALGVGALLSDLPLGAARPGVALVALFATLLACAPIGVAGAATWLVWKRAGIVTTLAAFGFALLGGVYFPVEVLPGALRPAAELVPLTLGVRAFRAALLAGASLRDVSDAIASLAVEAALGLPLAALALRWAFARALRRGTLALV